MDFAKTYSEIDRGGARSAMRNAALSAMSAGMKLTGGMEEALKKPRVQVLLLHHVFEDEETKFRELLGALRKRHTFISYSEAVQKIEAGTAEAIDKPYIAFSFDDGFRNCVQAAHILEEFGASGCFFVCPGIVGEKNEKKIEAFCKEKLELPRAVEFMDWAELERLREQGHEIGGHTVNHVRLSAVSGSEAAKEVRGSFEAITKRLGSAAHFAWTYGRFEDMSAEAVKAVYEAGYVSCASGVRGAHPPLTLLSKNSGAGSTNRACIRRDHVVAAWGVGQAEYLLAKNAKEMSEKNGEWPAGWGDVIR